MKSFVELSPKEAKTLKKEFKKTAIGKKFYTDLIAIYIALFLSILLGVYLKNISLIFFLILTLAIPGLYCEYQFKKHFKEFAEIKLKKNKNN